MASKTATKRLSKEYLLIKKSPPEYIVAKPLDKNILEWHYIFTGPPDTPYAGGQYHGRLVFPKDYPFAPPAIQMITPNGRFEINKDICTSMSNYHPQTWNPGWSVTTILVGLLSMMTGEERTTGALENVSDEQKKMLAAKSHEFNRNDVGFARVFSD
ncbi:Ubiquitin-conjugating enzyme E2 6 [Coemansia spiralis]|uniref:Ubiquitin-conjugating enzyme E2 6 n=2 Tax=Coemansia TaxID=4863 RepID=A0A9W8G231_9FUNG|nr:ubiquitin-conjugating enzyme/RWD-like protein [Coemansia spiralis]KAJ1989446.1 Ubiquitin-conjugating enzyme E2 6 [Coemansia umbellata]KAJ2620345.1 Ubiquitin-conjugating enzyme E2 6 [Coemansia sp. RSA 1358]KAJ2669661.1 Ubiquitin-conjugating enzyme E2 6 [Coemansia spiralis]